MGVISKIRGKSIIGTEDRLYDPQNVLRTATVSLTNAQSKALATTPQVLVAAPGAGKCIAVVEIYAKNTFLTTAFAGTNTLEFRYTSSNGAKVSADIDAAFLLVTATAYRSLKGVATELTPVLNAPIVVDTTGDATQGLGSLKFTVQYKVVTP
jgi:hypothetical protein